MTVACEEPVLTDWVERAERVREMVQVIGNGLHVRDRVVKRLLNGWWPVNRVDGKFWYHWTGQEMLADAEWDYLVSMGYKE